jgi:hypothetical protein
MDTAAARKILQQQLADATVLSFQSTTESESAVCRQKVTDAVRRMNDFLLDGVIPDDLK